MDDPDLFDREDCPECDWMLGIWVLVCLGLGASILYWN